MQDSRNSSANALELWQSCTKPSISIEFSLHFDVGVGVAIRIHGGETSTAYDAHNEQLLLGQVTQVDEDATSLMRGQVVILLRLEKKVCLTQCGLVTHIYT